MSTHPSSDTRIKNLDEWENEIIDKLEFTLTKDQKKNIRRN